MVFSIILFEMSCDCFSRHAFLGCI